MDFIAVFFTLFFLVVFVLGPIFGAESRPGFLRVDRKPRPIVGPPWNRVGDYSGK